MGTTRYSGAAIVLLAVAAMSTLGAGPAEAAFPGKNGEIAFSVTPRANVDTSAIFTINPDGSARTRLTDFGIDTGDTGPTFSPDGGKIAFARSGTDYYAPQGDIRLMNADGSGRVRLFGDGVNPVYDPSFSPDGEKIVYSSWQDSDGECNPPDYPGTGCEDGDQEIYVMNADGSGRVRLTYNGHLQNDANPVFSPDGDKIAFESNRDDGGQGIYAMNTDGSGQTRLSDPAYAGSPSFSPDGGEIAFVDRPPSSEGSDIYVMNADGSGQHALGVGERLAAGRHLRDVVFSPDGRKMAFNTESFPFDRDIYVMNADGSDQKLLTTAGGAGLDWQPNTAPTVRPLAPSSATTDRTPTMAAKASDPQTDLSKSDLTLKMDGRRVTRDRFSYDRSADRLRYVPGVDLAYGSHEAKVVARDETGLGKSEAWEFKIVR